MRLDLLDIKLLERFKESVPQSIGMALNKLQEIEIPFDYFKFYNSVSSVYSSKIEGENIEFDSFFKHKFLNVPYQPDYTKKADDLYKAYEFIYENDLNIDNLFKAHSILSSSILPESQQGRIRKNPMYVINSDDRIEYVAAEASIIEAELSKLFQDIDKLKHNLLSEVESFYFASLIHLVFVKIHPFQDGNGRAGRLIEKWFLLETIGERATAVQLEKNYYRHLDTYYKNIKKIGLEYDRLNYEDSLDFLSMTINCIF
jgi:Fic family protein